MTSMRSPGIGFVILDLLERMLGVLCDDYLMDLLPTLFGDQI